MTVLVTGGAGYIGSHMVLALTDAGEDVVVLDNLTTGYWWAVSPKAKLIEGDIGDEALLSRLMSDHSFDAIIHFAGSIVVPDSVTDPLGYYLNNTVKSRMLMHCAVKAKVPRFIFSSTAAVYGNPKTQPVFEAETAGTDFALWHVEADDRVDVARLPMRPMACNMWRCAISMWRGPTRRAAPGNRRRAPRI